jgi:hypothetical protein
VWQGSATTAAAKTNIEAWALMDEWTDKGGVGEDKAGYWAEDSKENEVWATLKKMESDEEELVTAAGRPPTSTVKVEL